VGRPGGIGECRIFPAIQMFGKLTICVCGPHLPEDSLAPGAAPVNTFFHTAIRKGY
jgi:hypothetical protein